MRQVYQAMLDTARTPQQALKAQAGLCSVNQQEQSQEIRQALAAAEIGSRPAFEKLLYWFSGYMKGVTLRPVYGPQDGIVTVLFPQGNPILGGPQRISELSNYVASILLRSINSVNCWQIVPQ
jgi:hypothetical protein